MEQTTSTYEAREQMLTIRLPKKLDHHSCRNLRWDVGLLLAGNYTNRIIFDFAHTSSMDSSGTEALLNHHRQMVASRGTVAYYGAGPQVRRILEMSRVSRPTKGYEDKESTIKG